MKSDLLYKGKRIDENGFNIGKKYVKNGRVFISMQFKFDDNKRNYHFCDQVIPESVCVSSTLYDYDGHNIFIYDILKNKETNEEVFLYRLTRSCAYTAPLKLINKIIDIESDKEILDLLEDNKIKIGRGISNKSDKYIFIENLYEYPYIFRKIKSANSLLKSRWH